MSQAITSGMISYQNPQTLETKVSNWFQLGDILESLPSTYELIDINTEHQEILLKIQDPSSFYSNEIRELLQELQDKFLQSFVALINLRSQYILITVRG